MSLATLLNLYLALGVAIAHDCERNHERIHKRIMEISLEKFLVFAVMAIAWLGIGIVSAIWTLIDVVRAIVRAMRTK